MQHNNLASGRWDYLTLSEQLGNVGSEVGRAIHARTAEDKKLASYRALELLDLTIGSKNLKTVYRQREISRAREVAYDFLLGGNKYHTDASSLEKYFMNFAVASRLLK